MGNEMGDINVSKIEEEENTAVEAQEDSSQHANQGDDECGKDQINVEGEGKDLHEKVEGVNSDNSTEGGTSPVAKLTSDGEAKEVKGINTTSAIESEPHTAEALESKPNNQDEHSKAHMVLLQEGHEGSPSYPTVANKNSLGAEENQNLDETSVDANIDQTISQKKLRGTRITKDRHETGTKDEMENGFDNKRSQEVPTVVNLSRNDSSKPAGKAISQGTSSNIFEVVPQIQDKSLILNENKETIESKSENKNTDQAVNESNTDEVKSSQSEFVMVGSVRRNGKENVESSELTEMTPIMETVPTELPTTQCNHEDEEEETEEKIIEAIEEKKENFTAVGIITEAREKPKLDTGIFQSAGNDEVDIAVAELRTSPRFNFDLSMEARFEEFDLSPSLHNKKTQTKSLSILNDAAATFGNPIQDQAVSAEEKIIQVEGSDLNWSRAPFLIFLATNEEKGNVADTKDCEKKGVEEPWTATSKEVALVMGSGKRKLRPSLFTCIRRAAAIS